MEENNNLGNQTGEPNVDTPVTLANETPVYTNPNPIAPEVEVQAEVITPVVSVAPVQEVVTSVPPISVQEVATPVSPVVPVQEVVTPESQATPIQETVSPVSPVVTPMQESVTPVQAVQPTQETSNNTNYTYGNQVNYQQNHGTPTQNVADEYDRTPLEMKDWVLILLAMLIPCCGNIILYSIWAFSKKGNINRRNFCRAGLIFLVIFQMFIFVTAFINGITDALLYY